MQVDNTHGNSPYDRHLSDIPVTYGHPSAHHPRASKGARNNHHSAQHSITIGELGGVTLSLSDRYIFLSGYPEGLCAESPTTHHTFPSRKDSKRLSPMAFHRSEPGGPARTARRRCTADQHGEPACGRSTQGRRVGTCGLVWLQGDREAYDGRVSLLPPPYLGGTMRHMVLLSQRAKAGPD